MQQLQNRFAQSCTVLVILFVGQINFVSASTLLPIDGWRYEATNPGDGQTRYFDQLEKAVNYKCSIDPNRELLNFVCPVSVELEEDFSGPFSQWFLIRYQWERSTGVIQPSVTNVFSSSRKVCPVSHPKQVFDDVNVNVLERCEAPVEDLGCPGEKRLGNPCNVATGNKYQSEADFVGFTRSYNSGYLTANRFGKGWRHNHQKKLLIAEQTLTIVSGTGRGEPWVMAGGVWQGDADSDYTLTEQADESFVLSLNNGGSETYAASGELLTSVDSNGNQTTYTYLYGQLREVSNFYGESISFSYIDDHVSIVTDELGNEYLYVYDAIGNLMSVTYPDATPANSADNPKRIYHYENADFPNHLTGITDENGVRYATYAYDANGLAISTEHAQTTNPTGQEKFELDYQGAN